MPQNFIACDRGQSMLLPPDLMDWVPDDHVVWSILGAVEQMDLSAFYGTYRENGQGRAAYEPSMMVALLLYSYARGNRSSRGIERACVEDVAFAWWPGISRRIIRRSRSSAAATSSRSAKCSLVSSGSVRGPAGRPSA
jgi:transposase